MRVAGAHMLVDLVIGLILLEYLFFIMAVGRARGKLGVPAPATTGHPEFERYYRVQMNTLENLVIVIPCMWIFARYVSEPIAATLGMVFLVGRAVYFMSYIRDPKKRGWGYLISSLPMLALLIGAIVGPALTWLNR
jgi:glutathione S-transferase